MQWSMVSCLWYIFRLKNKIFTESYVVFSLRVVGGYRFLDEEKWIFGTRF